MSIPSRARQLSSPPQLCGCYVPPCLKPWHGCSLSFTSAIPAFYQDNSFQKTIRLKQKLTDTRLALVRKHLIAKARIERVKVQQEQQEAAKSLHIHQLRVQREMRISAVSRYNAAVKIQKVVRGWLSRLRTDRDAIERDRERTLHEVKSLEAFTHWWFLCTEKEVAEKAKVVQRAFRRYRRLKMLSVVAKAYAILQEREQCAISLTLTSVFRRFLAARSFRQVLIELTRDASLLRIRRKLACLRIGVLWRRLGFSVKLVRSRIRKYVRRLRARRKASKVAGGRRTSNECESPSNILSNYTSPKGDAFVSLDSGRFEDLGEVHNRSSMYSSLRSNSPNETERGKMHPGMKLHALGFHPPKELTFCPLLERRRLESPGFGPSTPENVFARLLAPTECANQRSSTSHSHRTTFSHRRTATATPTALQTRLSCTGTPVGDARGRTSSRGRHRYMDATQSFTIAMESRAEEEEGEPPKKRSPSRWHPRGNVFGLTISWTSKRRSKPRRTAPKKSWRPFFATSEAEYIPSLDNLTYSAKPFTALRYRPDFFPRPQTTANQHLAELEPPEEDASQLDSAPLSSNLTPMLFSAGDMPACEHFSGF